VFLTAVRSPAGPLSTTDPITTPPPTLEEGTRSRYVQGMIGQPEGLGLLRTNQHNSSQTPGSLSIEWPSPLTASSQDQKFTPPSRFEPPTTLYSPRKETRCFPFPGVCHDLVGEGRVPGLCKLFDGSTPLGTRSHTQARSRKSDTQMLSAGIFRVKNVMV
jgi:hypothetical protein